MNPEEIRAMQQAFADFKAANELLTSQVKSYSTAHADAAAQLEKTNNALDALEQKINARMDAEAFNGFKTELQARLDQMEAKLTRKGAFGDGTDKAAALQLAKDAFFGALRFVPAQGGRDLSEVLGPEKMKALVLSSDTQGGYLAPSEYVMEILANVVEFAGIRAICRQRSTTRTTVQIPKRTTTAAASWTSETGTRAETTNPAFGMVELTAHEMYAMCKVSKQELEDSAFDLEGFLRDEFAEQFGLSEADAFINGNGVGKPEGILTNANVSYVAGGDASALTADGLIALYYELKEAYIANATWVMSRPTLKSVRQLKTAVTGEYVWTPGIKTDARPATILDRPYITAPEMPSIGAGAFPVLLGDFKRGYMILDRVAMEMMNDPYTSKSTGMIEFSARRRVGGKVVLAEAIKKLKISTT